MRLRIHAVHADDAHMRIHAHWCACENIDAHQPHTKAKKTTIPHLISPSIYAEMHVLELDLEVEVLTSMNEFPNHHFLGLTFYTLCICATFLHYGWAYMVLQTFISTNDFSHSVQGWGFSPVCISKCLPKVPAMLNDFLHSVVKLCCFSTLSLYTCSINFPVLVNDFLHCAQVWGFSPVWMRV